MGITFNPRAGQISKLYMARFAEPEEKEAGSVTKEPEDQLEISQQGQEAAAQAEGDVGFDEMAEKLESKIRSMTKEDFFAMAREQLGEPKQLEINWNAIVDPDHSIYAKAYGDALAAPFLEARSTIEDYYSDAYQEALHNPMGDPLMFIAAKYQCSWSNYYDASIPDNERQWTYNQLRAMLTGRRVSLNDPYALPNNSLNFATVEENARKAARDKIQELLRLATAVAGIIVSHPAKTGAAGLWPCRSCCFAVRFCVTAPPIPRFARPR